MANIRNNSSVANEFTKMEHENLFDIINEMIGAIEARDNATLLDKLEILENVLHAYFATGENVPLTLDSDFPQYAISHQSLLNKIKRIKDWLRVENGIYSKHEAKNYIDSLWSYLLQHVEDDEDLLKFMLAKDFHDFAPIRISNTPILHCSG